MKLPPDGFLSQQLEPWRLWARSEAAAWFILVDEINRSAIALLPILSLRRTSDRDLGAAAMFARALQSFEAVILLAERGMLADAGTIARNIVENAIYLGGFAQLDDFSGRMAESNNAHYSTMAAALADHLEEDSGIAETEEAVELRALIQEVKALGYRLSDIKLLRLAKEVGMHPLYQVVYRKLSGDSAHATLESIERHFLRGPAGEVEKLIFSPQRNGIEAILSAAISAFLGALGALHDVFPDVGIWEIVGKYNLRHHALSVTGKV